MTANMTPPITMTMTMTMTMSELLCMVFKKWSKFCIWIYFYTAGKYKYDAIKWLATYN